MIMIGKVQEKIVLLLLKDSHVWNMIESECCLFF